MRPLLLLCFALLFLGCGTKPKEKVLGPAIEQTESNADGDGTVVKSVQKGDPTSDD